MVGDWRSASLGSMTMARSSAPLTDTLRFLWSGSLFALALAACCGFAAFAVTSRQVPQFDATSIVYATQTAPADRWLGTWTFTPTRLDADAYGFALLNPDVLRDASARLGRDEPSEADLASLQGKIRVTADETSTASFLRIVVRDASAAVAARTANALADALIAWDAGRSSRELERIAGTLAVQISALEQAANDLIGLQDPVSVQELAANVDLLIDHRNSLRLVRAFQEEGSGSLTAFQRATPPSEPSAPRPVMSAVLGFVFGVVLGYGIVLVFQNLRAVDRKRTAVGATD